MPAEKWEKEFVALVRAATRHVDYLRRSRRILAPQAFAAALPARIFPPARFDLRFEEDTRTTFLDERDERREPVDPRAPVRPISAAVPAWVCDCAPISPPGGM